jgi:hypothetical protein
MNAGTGTATIGAGAEAKTAPPFETAGTTEQQSESEPDACQPSFPWQQACSAAAAGAKQVPRHTTTKESPQATIATNDAIRRINDLWKHGSVKPSIPACGLSRYRQPSMASGCAQPGLRAGLP